MSNSSRNLSRNVPIRHLRDEESVIRAHTFCIEGPHKPIIDNSYHEFVLIIRGHYHFKIGNCQYHGESGDCFFFPRHSPRAPQTSKEDQVAVLLITVPSSWPIHHLAFQTTDKLGRLMAIGQWMKTLTDTADGGDPTRLEHLLQVFIDEHQRLNAHQHPEAPLIVKAETLAASSMRYGSVSTIAETLGISVSTLNRLFQKHHNCTAQAWLQHLRAENALHLLRDGQSSMDEAAEAVGLSGGRSLQRLLKRHYGSSIRGLME